jgi:hypothetical protein
MRWENRVDSFASITLFSFVKRLRHSPFVSQKEFPNPQKAKIG